MTLVPFWNMHRISTQTNIQYNGAIAALESTELLEAVEMPHQAKGASDYAATAELKSIMRDIEQSLNHARRRATDILAA
jgi:hypothetical protein